MPKYSTGYRLCLHGWLVGTDMAMGLNHIPIAAILPGLVKNATGSSLLVLNTVQPIRLFARLIGDSQPF